MGAVIGPSPALAAGKTDINVASKVHFAFGRVRVNIHQLSKREVCLTDVIRKIGSSSHGLTTELVDNGLFDNSELRNLQAFSVWTYNRFVLATIKHLSMVTVHVPNLGPGDMEPSTPTVCRKLQTAQLRCGVWHLSRRTRVRGECIASSPRPNDMDVHRYAQPSFPSTPYMHTCPQQYHCSPAV